MLVIRPLPQFTGVLTVIALCLAASGSMSAEGRQTADSRPPSRPPAILFAEQPSILVLIDGEPVYRAIADTNLRRIVNTRPFMVRDEAGLFYMKVFDGWMEAYALTGVWSVSGVAPRGVEPAFERAVVEGSVDLLSGADSRHPQERPSLDLDASPAIFVSCEPAELVVTDGPPRFVTIEGSALQYVENTTANVFKEPTDDEIYVLVVGRWFRAWTTDGPWEFIPSGDLPKDFSTIPDSSPKAAVKASIPSS